METLKRKHYEKLLEPLEEELVAMARWVAASGARIVVLFEGRDTAGKGGAIDAIAERLPPRQCRKVALGKPTERDSPAGKQYTLQKAGPTALYLATAAPLPGKVDVADEKVVKMVLDNAVKSIQTGLGGKVVSDRQSRVADKYPARDIELETPALGVYRARLILAPGGFIQVVTAGPKEFVDGAEAGRFRGCGKRHRLER